ncbi:MAG: 4-(cytidine 5'-diphospho)-2-C-methyl-D-erythritol kinase [Acidobacteriaceae bacterium]
MTTMPTNVRSYCKINLGLAIGPVRADGFHGLATLYQTLDLHDVVTVSARRLPPPQTTSLRLASNDPRVPLDHRNTAWKMVALALERLGIAAEVSIHIEKNLPVQGGLGGGSANAVAALMGLERELDVALPGPQRMELAAEVGSDVPLFLLGGAVLGLGRGEEIYPFPDLPATHCVVVAPGIGVSTPQAFRDWDAIWMERAKQSGENPALTEAAEQDRLKELSRALASSFAEPGTSGVFPAAAAVPTGNAVNSAKDLAGNPLLALVRTGIENDFEQVVFPQYPLLRDIKRLLLGIEPVLSGASQKQTAELRVPAGSSAVYAALSGSGSALFGLYQSEEDAAAAQQRVLALRGIAPGIEAFMTKTLPRADYWRRMFA